MDVDPRDVGATQADAFGVLLHALKPFIEDLQLLLQSEFHRFMDLPAELRFAYKSTITTAATTRSPWHAKAGYQRTSYRP
jgi:hypothetical protein